MLTFPRASFFLLFLGMTGLDIGLSEGKVEKKFDLAVCRTMLLFRQFCDALFQARSYSD